MFLYLHLHVVAYLALFLGVNDKNFSLQSRGRLQELYDNTCILKSYGATVPRSAPVNTPLLT